ncbi:MAG: response regulator [Burkholderiaceae bacterium]|nr:response regulator [Burkholderiaceae bacterium]
MAARTRAHDWAASPLGPIHTWPQSLLSALSMLLPSKAQIVLFWGPEFVVFYNDAYRPVFGAKHPHALGMAGRDAWSEIWDGQLHPLLRGVVETGEAFWATDLRFSLERHGYPEETYFDVSYDPVRDESGRVGGVFCIVAETTGRVVGERRLALLKDLAGQSTARTAHDACVQAMEVLARNPDEVPFALAHLDGAPVCGTPDAHSAHQQAEPARVTELPLLGAGGAPAGRLVLGLNPRRPRDAQYEAFLALVAGQVSTAIANARAYEEERKRAEALAELDRAKTAFFSNVSHEFRTPLTLILGLLEEMLARDDAAQRDQLLAVQRNGQRLLKLVNVLLDFARIEAGRAQASYQQIDLAALTADLASNFRAACDRAGLRLDVSCTGPAHAWVDRDMWEKVVLNLLSNAFKFTLQGGITVRVQGDAHKVCLTVADTGVGIAQDALPRMFERFRRIEGAAGRSHEGSGIGLALVHELVKLHGGTISVASQLARGTTFTVELPTGHAHLPREHLRQHAESPASGRADAYVAEAMGWLADAPAIEPQPTAGAPPGGRVLVADDNADLRHYVRRLLAEHYEVQVVADGLAALQAARARRPDVIVSDVMMPRLDGFGLIPELRRDPALSDVPVLLLSARAGEESRLEGLGRGADDYLVKPFSARELQGRVAALRGADDIRRRALDALRQSRAQVQALLDHAPLGVYLVDADFRIREMNPVALPVFGDIAGGVVGRDFEEVIRILWPKAYADELVTIFRRTMDTGQSHVTAEQAERRLDRGVVEYYEWRVDRIPQADGRNGVVCYFRDISAQVQARKEIEQSHQALRAADQRKNEFLATLSHELRNPLAPLRNALHLIRLHADNPPALASARDLMERQLNSLVRLVDDLLEMSRITSGSLELKREPVELSSVVRNAAETSEPVIRAGRHRLEVALPDEPLWIEGDPVRLAQIVSNLLNNAAKYTPEGGLVSLTAQRERNQVVLKVRDNGIGIAPDALRRIFDMFSRERRGRGPAEGGLGIGLTLSRRLAEMHGGTIDAHSAGEGLGSEFIVRLPMAASRVPPQARRQPTDLRMPQHVLIVDDNRDAAESLGQLLQLLGATVTVAYDGPSAIDAFSASAASVVLLDIGLPGMNGYEVARAMRSRHPERRPLIIAVTGWGQETDRREAAASGIDHHLVKPADIHRLQELLSSAAPSVH